LLTELGLMVLAVAVGWVLFGWLVVIVLLANGAGGAALGTLAAWGFTLLALIAAGGDE
jgi:hypothetical protein